MLRRLILAAAVIFAAQSCGVASPSELARKAYSAERASSFSGTMENTVYVYGQAQVSSVKVQRSHARSRMEYVSGPLKGTVLVEDGKSVFRLDTAAKTIYTSVPPNPPDNLKLLLSNYKPVITGQGTVAGRSVQILRLEPVSAGNPKAVLYVDSKTSVILRNERYLYDGKLAARSEYRSISYKAPDSGAFSLPAGWRRISVTGDGQSVSATKLSSQVGFDAIKPSYVPAGYVLDGYYAKSTGSGRLAAALRYTNGLNTISVFECQCLGRGRGRGMGRGFGRQGGGCCGQGQCILRSDPQAQVAQIAVGKLTVTVMSNLSPALLKKMAESF